tara:strand:+ start:445 stop:798 length:354 start_codon:yes stop_codon:yes gene_type:complete
MNDSIGFKHQDWNEVLLRKPISVETKNNSNNGHKTKAQHELEGNDIVAPPKTSQELKLAIQKGRLMKKISQKQLATNMNTTTQLISQYENGKVVPSNAIIAKLEKQLGVKLPRPKKK